MRFRFALFALPLAFAAAAFAACNGESEGMPCDPAAGNSGNDDCQSPLICKPGLPNAQGPRCCPQDLSQATTPECSLGANANDAARPEPPPEASSGDGPSTDDGPAGDAPTADGPAEAGPGDASDGAAAADGPTG
jgi:hypothetical protein